MVAFGESSGIGEVSLGFGYEIMTFLAGFLDVDGVIGRERCEKIILAYWFENKSGLFLCIGSLVQSILSIEIEVKRS